MLAVCQRKSETARVTELATFTTKMPTIAKSFSLQDVAGMITTLSVRGTVRDCALLLILQNPPQITKYWAEVWMQIRHSNTRLQHNEKREQFMVRIVENGSAPIKCPPLYSHPLKYFAFTTYIYSKSLFMKEDEDFCNNWSTSQVDN